MALQAFRQRRQGLPSRLRDRVVTIQQLSDGVGTSGAPVGTWSTLVASMPASRLDISGRERFIAGQESAAVDTTWEINYRADMDPELVDVPKNRRLVVGGRVHDIVAARQSERRKLIELVTLASSRLP